jgi:hypothetical protein
MKSSRTRRSKKASPDGARKPPGVARAMRDRRGIAASASASSRIERERTLAAREETVARRERALRLEEADVSIFTAFAADPRGRRAADGPGA